MTHFTRTSVVNVDWEPIPCPDINIVIGLCRKLVNDLSNALHSAAVNDKPLHNYQDITN